MRDPERTVRAHAGRSPRSRRACTWSPGSPVSPTRAARCRSSASTCSTRSTPTSIADVRRRRPARLPRAPSHHLLRPGPPRPTTSRATLKLYLAHDELGQPFLLLTGFEPDFQWERFTAAVLELIDRFKVKTTTWVHAIPMPVPHTRPIGVTVSGNRAELIDAMSIWKPHTQVPGERAAPGRVPPAGAGASDRRLRAARPALPRRHRVPARRGRPRSRASAPRPA